MGQEFWSRYTAALEHPTDVPTVFRMNGYAVALMGWP
jgi:hypothetical protein